MRKMVEIIKILKETDSRLLDIYYGTWIILAVLLLITLIFGPISFIGILGFTIGQVSMALYLNWKEVKKALNI